MPVFYPFHIPTSSSYAETASFARIWPTPTEFSSWSLDTLNGPRGTPGLAATECPPGYLDATTSSLSPLDGVTYPAVTSKAGRDDYLLCYQIPSRTPTPTVTPTVTPSITATPTVTPTSTITPTITASPTATPSVTPTLSPTPTITPSITRTVIPSITPTVTPSRTATPSITPSRTVTPSITTTPSITATPSITPTRTITPSISFIPSLTATPSRTITPSATITPSRTITPSVTITPSITPSRTITPSVTITPSQTVTPSVTITPSRTITPSPSSISCFAYTMKNAGPGIDECSGTQGTTSFYSNCSLTVYKPSSAPFCGDVSVAGCYAYSNAGCTSTLSGLYVFNESEPGGGCILSSDGSGLITGFSCA